MQIKRMRWQLLAGVLTMFCANAWSQSGNGRDNPDWVEAPVPPPPQFSKDGLIPIDMPPYISVKVGVDPATIYVGTDGVVRYVLVTTNMSGNTSAVYEGIRCATDEVKSYARMSSAGQWNLVNAPEWKSLGDNMPSRHAFAFARQGACQNRIAPSLQEIIAVLKSPKKLGAALR